MNKTLKNNDSLMDEIKSFWNRRPCNIKHSKSELGTPEYFNEVEDRKYLVEPHIPPFADFAKWKGKKVLEIGCGIGTDTINFARHGAQVTAMDFSEKSLEVARQRAKIFGLENSIQFYCGNAEHLDQYVPVEQYDLIYSFGVIHHTPNPENVIKQLAKYTHKNTVLKIMVYHRYAWKVCWIWLKGGFMKFSGISQLVAKHAEAQTGCPVAYIYSKSEAKKLLEVNRAFSVNEISIDHIFPYKISEYTRYRYKKVWYFRILPEKIFRKIEKLIGWHLLLTACVNSN